MEMRTRGDSAVSLEGDRVPLAHAASSRPPPLLLSCARLACWICCWYTISISLTLYNKWFFHIYDFHYPLLVTSLHIAIKMPAARLLMWLLGLPKLHLFDGSCSRLMRVAPTGLTMAADIGCSNLSMLYISITFYTIAKSSVPVWILFFSILLRLDKPRLSVAITVLCIGAGISLASIHPESDEAGGGRRRLLLLDRAPHHREAAPPRDRTAAALWRADRLAEARGAEWHGVEPLAGGLLPGEPAPRVDFPRLASRPRRRAGGSEAGGVEAGGGEAGGGAADEGAAEGWQTSQSTQPPQPPRSPPPPQTSPPPPTPAEEGGEEGSQGSGAAGESESASDFLFGCLLILLASACAGFRWACTHLLLSPDALADPSPADATAASPPPKAGARVHPAVLLYHISPWGLLLLLPIAVALEAGELGRYLGSASSEQMVAVGGLAAVGGCVSFLLLLAEMQVVKLSSALTLSVAGIFKELLTVLCSALLLGDSLTPYNVSGLMLCLLGIAHYTYEGWSRAQGKARETAAADARASGAAAAHAWQEGSSAASMAPASERPVRLCGASEAAGRGVEEPSDHGFKPREDAARV